MRVVIMCGGLGTRLREETEFRPKPMVPIGGQPILWHIMKLYAAHGYKDFVLCLGYKGEVIKDYFRNYLWHRSDITLTLGRVPEITYHNSHDEDDWTVTLLETGLETQTGGRLRRALGHVDDRFLLTYGDGLSDCDIGATVRFHEENGGLVTLTGVQPSGRFGEMSMDGVTVASFREKPALTTDLVNGGFMVVDRGIERYLTGDDCVLERDALTAIAEDGLLKARPHRGFWQCMDTPREHVQLEALWASGNAPWKIW